MNSFRGVIFDLDGTLVQSGLDTKSFRELRTELGIPLQEISIMDYIYRMPKLERADAFSKLYAFERRGILNINPSPGVFDLLKLLREKNILTSVLTANSRTNAIESLVRVGLDFDVIISRDDATIKPSPDGVESILKNWDLKPYEVLVIGDYLFDITAAHGAGCKAALITNGEKKDYDDQAEFVWETLSDGIEFFKSV
jgi:HAD superfamily hydrolase (TIGR01509 family)